MIEKISKFQNWFSQLNRGFIELLFPVDGICPLCGGEKSKRRGLGVNCLAKIAVISPPVCRKCGRPLRLEASHRKICGQCETTNYYFEKARAVAVYEGALREYLAELKYRYRPALGAALGELLVEWIKLNRDYQKIDLIIPIPIHHSKWLARGYNQAELMANPLQRYLGIEVKTDIIKRLKFTETQNSLDREARFDNVKDAFQVVNAKNLRQAKILLVDDILTTGATTSEAARVLLRAGAANVRVLTLATGVADSQWFS